MRYRRFGKTGLYVSELCLGTMTFGGKGFWEVVGRLGVAEAEELIGASLDAGVNFIDTADVYSEGESETIAGAALASIDASLRRLKLDFVDLYQIHGFDADTPIEETVRSLDEIVRAGKARYAGFCNLPARQSMKALAYADAHDLARFVSAQRYYSIAGRDIEREVVPLAEDQGLAILPWSPLAGGLLSGKFDLEKPGPAGARRASLDFPPVDRGRARRVLQEPRAVSETAGASVARVELAWLLTRPFVTSVIIGAKTREQLVDNLGASDVRLSPEQVSRLDAASALPPEVPGWMLERQSQDRRPPAEKS